MARIGIREERKVRENIIATQSYVRQLDDVRRSIYIGEFVNVKHQDPEIASKKYTIDRTGEICYIHRDGTYFNVKFDDTGVQESYFPSDVLEGVVRLHSEGRFDR